MAGIGALGALGGCTKSNNGTQMNGINGTGAAPAVSQAGSGPSGTGGSASTQTGTGGAGAQQSGKAGSGSEFPKTGGTTGGSAGMSTSTGGTGTSTAGTVSSGSSGSGAPPSGVCDTSAFMTDCTATGANWGMPSMFGPCKSGITIYGVRADFGPYGVRAKYNVGSGAGGQNFTAAFPLGGCGTFIDGFGADPIGSADLKNTHDLDFDKYSVFYPGCMPDGEKFPLITWGDGTCAMPEGYGSLLRYVASFGYIVVAPNDLGTGDGSSMRRALDFMLAENGKSDSEFYNHVDADKIGAMGHSQGAGATLSAAAADARIKAIIAWNSGSSSDKPFLNVSGDMDIGAGTDPASIRNATMGASKPGAWLWMHQVPNDVNCKMMGDPKCSTTGTTAPGHLTLMMEPERVQEIAVAWWDMMLKQKPEAKAMFIGDQCKLCSGTAYPSMWGATGWRGVDHPTLEFGHNAMLQ